MSTAASPILQEIAEILAVGLTVVSVLSFAIGLILDTLSRVRNEQRRLAYLSCRDRATPAEVR